MPYQLPHSVQRKEITPNEIPSEIEYMKGIAKMQMNAGIASSISLQLIFATDCIMKKPTTISAGAVAKEGIARNTGEKNSARMNSNPETIEVRPVLPPSAIPEEDSTKVVMVEVPRHAPTVVPTASAIRAPLMPGSLPSLSSMFAFVAHPIRVPSVSKISTNRNANTTTTKFRDAIAEKSILNRVGATDAGAEMMPLGIRL